MALQPSDSILFHFSCYALCEITFYEDDGTVTADSAKVLGFWLTRQEAEIASKEREARLLDQHNAQYRVTNGRWPAWPFNDHGYFPNHYEIVPLSSVRASLWDLENTIEEAAKARVSGIGVENRGAK
jgi:hypothetical protein